MPILQDLPRNHCHMAGGPLWMLEVGLFEGASVPLCPLSQQPFGLIPFRKPSCLSDGYCHFTLLFGGLVLRTNQFFCCCFCCLLFSFYWISDSFASKFMFIIFMPGIFFINFICQKKGEKTEHNQILLYCHIFIKLNHFSYMLLSFWLFLISTNWKRVHFGAGPV